LIGMRAPAPATKLPTWIPLDAEISANDGPDGATSGFEVHLPAVNAALSASSSESPVEHATTRERRTNEAMQVRRTQCR